MGGMFSKGGTFSKDVVDPNEANWGDLSTGEKSARVGMGTLGGLGKGLQNQQQQNAGMRQGGGAAPIQVTPTPQAGTNYDPNYLQQWMKPNPYDAFGR